ncbi:MAG: hypothetical protein HY762_05655 [Planctomycetes bacterium]|nr:hypothetical protein [Planctomycetota bacterium]
MKEYGKCCVCGEDIGPYYGDDESDCLCKACYNRTHSRSSLPSCRNGSERVLTAGQRQEIWKWQDEIDERIDREEQEGSAGVTAKLPKRPLIGAGYATTNYHCWFRPNAECSKLNAEFVGISFRNPQSRIPQL